MSKRNRRKAEKLTDEGKSKPSDMTLEQTHAAIKAEFEALKVEAAANLARLTEADKLLAEAKVIVAERDTLKAEVEALAASLKEATEKVAALEQTAKPVAAQAAAIVAACSADPAAISPDVAVKATDTRSIREQYEALASDPAARKSFYKAHKAELDKGWAAL